MRVMRIGYNAGLSVLVSVLVFCPVGCRSARIHRQEADTAANNIIREKQLQAIGRIEPLTVEPPAETLRRRLLLGQELQHSGPASLGSRDLKPLKHWPDDDYLDPTKAPPATQPVSWDGGVLHLSLVDALRVAAYNSREYQSRKEQIFERALSLELERDKFRTTFAAILRNTASADLGGEDAVAGLVSSPDLQASHTLTEGLTATARLALDLVKLLTQSRSSTLGIGADLSISMPLLRRAGRHIVMEPLTQAERNVTYELLEFEQYKRSFAVSVASSYLAVLESLDQLRNQEDAYRRIIVSTRMSRMMAETGRLRPLEYDQALQNELRTRDTWIDARRNYAATLDSFKRLIGLPPDALVELDPEELRRLASATQKALGVVPPSEQRDTQIAPVQPTTQPGGPTTTAIQEAADAPVVLAEPSDENAGPYELPEKEAVRIALENRPDLLAAQGRVYDAQRRVVVAADALQAGLSISATGSFGERRGLGSADQPNGQLRPEKGSYSISAPLELPLERTAEQNAYRSTLIDLEGAVRAVQQLEDEIKLAVRNQLRALLRWRESLRTQTMSVVLAQRRVESTQQLLLLGRAQVRDVLEAQSALVSAQDSLTRALKNYRLAELELQRDLGVLQVNHEGLWREYVPGGKAQ